MTLLHKTSTMPNLVKAWEGIRHRPDSKGIDGLTIFTFGQNLTTHLKAIQKQMRAGTYKFQPLKGVPLEKGNKKVRPLKVPAVADRVVQKAIQLQIQDKLNKHHHLNNAVSFAYIKDRRVSDAAFRIQELYASGSRWVFSADIINFFDNIRRDDLLNEYIYPYISKTDRSLDDLIANALKTEIGNRKQLEARGKAEWFPESDSGVAQGGVLSPLFANVYLSKFDASMTKAGYTMVRYADDLVIMCKSEEEAKAAHLKVKNELLELGLNIHPLPGDKLKAEKHSILGKFNRLLFLGLQFEGSRLYPSDKQFKKMIAGLRSMPIKEKPLVDNLEHIRKQAIAWGATYYFTDIDLTRYTPLNQALEVALRSTMKWYGFQRPLNRKLSRKIVERIGSIYFDVAVSKAKTSAKKKQSK